MNYDIFISYSRKDTEIANRICKAFDQAGITYFIDRQGIGGGMEFPTVLAEAILNCKLMLFLASKNSYNSKFTNSEVTFAFNKKPAGSIIPYIIDDSTLPPSLEFTFSSINIRTIQEHPIETTLINDICLLLNKKVISSNSNKVLRTSFIDRYRHNNTRVLYVAGILVLLVLLFGLLYFTNRHANSLEDKTSSKVEQNDSMLQFLDSANTNYIQALEVKKYEREIGKFDFLKIEYPVKGNKELLLNIQRWIKEQFVPMGINYNGELNDANQAIEFYTTSLRTKLSLPDIDAMSFNVTKVYEDDKIVTYVFNPFINESSYSEYFGATFRKTDGKKFSKDMIMQQSILPEVRKHFRSFYSTTTDDEFIKIMNSERNNSAIPLISEDIRLPHNSPWITENGFEFEYNDGEYNDYYISEVGGSISFSIPTSTMQKYLSEEGKTFIK